MPNYAYRQHPKAIQINNLLDCLPVEIREYVDERVISGNNARRAMSHPLASFRGIGERGIEELTTRAIIWIMQVVDRVQHRTQMSLDDAWTLVVDLLILSANYPPDEVAGKLQCNKLYIDIANDELRRSKNGNLYR